MNPNSPGIADSLKRKRNAICYDWDGTVIDSMTDKFGNFVEAILFAFNFGEKVEPQYLEISRHMIDFCHKEYGGELRVHQFDNVVNTLGHPVDFLRLLKHLREEPQQLKTSSYLRETHLYQNFREELNGDDRNSFNHWISSLIKELTDYLDTVDPAFPEFANISSRNRKFEKFDAKYTELNTAKSRDWMAFPAAENVIRKLSGEYDSFIGSSLLGPLLKVEAAKYPGIERCMIDIFGGDKSEAIRTVKKFGYEKIIFVGDMPADRVVAEQNDAYFYRIHPQKDRGNEDWKNMINSIEKLVG